MPAAHLLAPAEWRARLSEHAARADALTEDHRARRGRHERHAVEDFLFEYYPATPGHLRRWHPGSGVALAPDDEPTPHASWRWYRTDGDGTVRVDVEAFSAARGDTVRLVERLLAATAARPAATGCFGLHEWAMVYREPATSHRHPLPLRLGEEGTDAVVERHRIRCSHADAFRFFTAEASGRNTLRPTREQQVALEQPGCLHAAMDCYKWALKLGPLVPGDLLLDCFVLAREIRYTDMQASPYDVSSYGLEPVAIETPEGKAEYVRRQRDYADRSNALRRRLVDVCRTARAVSS